MKPIQPGMKAYASDGSTCTVVDVLVDPHDVTEHSLVLGANGYFGPDVVAPIAAVWCVDDSVHLELSARDVAALPPYNQETYCREYNLYSRAAARRGRHRAGAENRHGPAH